METKTLLRNPSLKWYDKVEIIVRFHKEMEKVMGESARGRLGEGWSYKKTAEALDISKVMVYQSMKASEILKKEPSLKYKYTSVAIMLDEERDDEN